MRFLSVIPFIFGLAAFIIGFLCIFAGDSRSFLSEYEILRLNTSLIGQNVLQQLISTNDNDDSGSRIGNLLRNLTSSLAEDANDALNSLAGSVATDLGISDFYSAHVRTYCEGEYTPAAVPNATLSRSAIRDNVTQCTRMSQYSFVPGEAVQASLDRTGTGLTLDDINWPDEIDDRARDLEKLVRAFLALYAITVGLAGLTVLFSLIWLIVGSRLFAVLTFVVAILGFLAAGIASAVLTVVKVRGDRAINDLGADYGVQAATSWKLASLSWAGTGCMLVATFIAFFGICFGSASKKRTVKTY